MMEGHGELEFLKTVIDFLLDLLVLDGDDLEHLLHVEDEVLEVAVLLDDLVDGERHPHDPVAVHVVDHLVLLGDEVGYVNQVGKLGLLVGHQLALRRRGGTLARLCRYSR